MNRSVSRQRRMLLRALALVGVAGAAGPAARAQPRTDVHGALDAYAGHGVAMAWGILRGKDEAGTLVVVRVEADRARYRSLVVTGRDPFTQRGEALVPETALDHPATVRVARPRFADLPQTEWRFVPQAASGAILVVDYRGVPDTTPEFDDAAKLDASLTARIERARKAPASGN